MFKFFIFVIVFAVPIFGAVAGEDGKEPHGLNIMEPLVGVSENRQNPIIAVKEESLSTVTELPLRTVTELPLRTVTELPLSTVTEFPLSTVTEVPLSTVTESPLSTVADVDKNESHETVGKKHTEQPPVEKIIEELWRRKCKNGSNEEVDVPRIRQLHRDHFHCQYMALNTTRVKHDIRTVLANLSQDNPTFSDEKKSRLYQVAVRYCARMRGYLDCEDMLLPIYNECFSPKEVKGISLVTEIFKSVNDFFCINGAEHLVEWSNGQIIECAFTNITKLSECYDQYLFALDFGGLFKENPLFRSVPKPDVVCSSIEVLKSCALRIFEQCQLTETAGELVKAMYEYVNTEKLCKDFSNIST